MSEHILVRRSPGRPLPDGAPKDKLIAFRVPTELHAAIESYVAGIGSSASDWLRELARGALGTETSRDEQLATATARIADLEAELARVRAIVARAAKEIG